MFKYKKNLIQCTVIFAFLLLVKQVDASYKQEIRDGNKLYEQKKYDLSIEKYNEALEKEPNSDIVHV